MSSPEGWAIERISARHIRRSFDSGEPALDLFLEKFARQNDEREIGRTFVAVRGSDPRVLGYYTLTFKTLDSHRFPPEEVKRLPRYPLPLVHLARLAVDRSVQGQGVGEALLASALKRAVIISEHNAVFAVDVRAKTPQAKRFYEKHFFRPFPDEPLHLYLPIADVRELVT